MALRLHAPPCQGSGHIDATSCATSPVSRPATRLTEARVAIYICWNPVRLMHLNGEKPTTFQSKSAAGHTFSAVAFERRQACPLRFSSHAGLKSLLKVPGGATFAVVLLAEYQRAAPCPPRFLLEALKKWGLLLAIAS
jgi:hypothetical protein